MPSYYQQVIGNLRAGDIARAEDINDIQTEIIDALKVLLSDMHDGESYILGTENTYKNSFILKAAQKTEGRYVDSYNGDLNSNTNPTININKYDIRQPIPITKTSLYSILVKIKNTSNRDIPIICELQDETEEVLSSNTITLKKNTEGEVYEIIFDLDYYPTPPSLDFKDVIERDGKDISVNTSEESFEEGYEEEETMEESGKNYFSTGISQLYLVMKAPHLDEFSLKEQTLDEDASEVLFDANNSLGVFYEAGSLFPDKNVYSYQKPLNGEYTKDVNQNNDIENKPGNLCYRAIYANEMTYICSYGSGVIGGERVDCLDTHVSVEGGSSEGNTLTRVYMGEDGHLYASNQKSSFTTNIDEFEKDNDDPMPPHYLPIALILTYSTSYGTGKEPLVIQDGENQRPRSHHERLRRIEKKIDWDEDIALPARIKRTITNRDWVDETPEDLDNIEGGKEDSNFKDGETLKGDNVFTTTDENGNLVVRLSNAKSQTISVTLKEKLTDSDGNKLKLANTDVLNVSSFATMENMVHDSKAGTLILDKEKAKDEKETTSKKTTTKDSKTKTNTKTKESNTKKTEKEFDPWDDSALNTKAGKDYKKTEREYKVVSGKNGAHDKSSYYPGMTFYTSTNYKLKKLTIPIHKFKNCSSVKFYIWKRQDKNNKKNVVNHLQKLYKSKEFSLKKAKEKGKFQYMDEGFTMTFGKGGLSLPKGQYVVIAVPVPKSGTGSLFVETYKPKNSKNFCIKYRGAANASHFHLVDRYQEVWYNSAKATVVEEDYYKTGTVVSKTLTWTDKSLERIASIKPIVGKNITTGKKGSYELSVNTGGKWIKVTPGKENTINDGGASTFKWKLTFKGDGKTSPKLAYNSKDKYAIRFIITREKTGQGINLQESEDIDKSLCITSKPFDGDEILREYVGDMNLGANGQSRFEGYEFARVWADNNENEGLLIDIQASDRSAKLIDSTKTGGEPPLIDLWSLHYCDLTLDDFTKINVDYSDYDEDIEYDENNLRLKLDSNHSYNDDDIELLEFKNFTKIANDIDDDTEDDVIRFKAADNLEENQLFLKKVFENPLDLTKYTGLKFKFNIQGVESNSSLLKGLAIYLSSSETIEVPSNKKYRPENIYEVLDGSEVLPPEIDPDISTASYYDGKVVELPIKAQNNGNRLESDVEYYQYVKYYDSDKQKYIWKKQQVYDLKPFNIYKFGEIECSKEVETIEGRIEINQNSNNARYVKEIGIITLNEDGEYSVDKGSLITKLSATSTTKNSIIVTLEDVAGNPLANKEVLNSSTEELLTTNEDGQIEVLVSGDGSLDLIFEGEEVEGNVLEKSTLSIAYEFENEGIIETSTIDGTYDEDKIKADVTRDTRLKASVNNEDKIVVKLEENDNGTWKGLKGKALAYNNTSATTDNNGEIKLNLKDKNEVKVVFKVNKVDGTESTNNQSILYKPKEITIKYDLRPPADRVTFEGQDTITPDKITLELEGVRAISEDVLKIYDPEEIKKHFNLTPNTNLVTIYQPKNLVINSSTYGSTTASVTKTTPLTSQINIKYKDMDRGMKLCYMNNPFQGGLSNYKHIGIQFATDVYIPKDCLMFNICADKNGEDVIASVNLPTMNSIYYPTSSKENINLSQIFKKIDIGDTEIKSFSITTTEHFVTAINHVVTPTKPAINLFLGKVVLYRAETIPIYHNKMRYKFYSTANGKIRHFGDKNITADDIAIRKIGAILDYH